ncbi:hypothetical protein P2G88_01085 [Aliiglaciecola sp. CAU 1673]|uniref:hypothetical protein n=1 Tax=Aliiglaciecola sp. CAU 1673 TaxID=3032595 RepID=UPI0023DC0A0B|nr:hypothetical protein [Aliiglaciecola sp. CAU 1673]MDF2176844.1 hypothetical protein [Aliiglaciecola sp. CAU 1673]
MLQYRDGDGAWQTSGTKYWGTSYTWYGITSLNQRSYRMAPCSDSQRCSSSWTGPSNAISISPIPPAPSFVSASLSGNNLTLSWGAASGATYYKLQYRDGSGSWNTSGGTYYGTSNYWSNVPPLSLRSYRMAGCNGSGCSGWSAASNAISIDPVPRTMSAPTSSLNGNDHTLSWSAVAYSDYYQLEYRDGAGAWNLSGGTYTGTSKLWVDSAPVHQRSYRMRACNESGCGAWSAASNAITIDPVPGTVATPAAGLSGNNISLSWSTVTYSDYYQIQKKDGSGSWAMVVNSISSTSTTWNNVAPVTSRVFQVRACNESGCGAWSGASSAVTIDPVPGAMATPSVSLSGNDITLSWAAVTYADNYQLEYRNGSGAWTPVSGTYTGTSKQWLDVTPVSARSYRMRACNESGCGSWSAASNTITIDPVPGTVATPAAGLSGNNISLSWSTVTYSDYYQIQKKDGSGSWAMVVNSISSTSTTWNNVAPVTSRVFQVRACNESGCGAWSGASNAVTIDPIPGAMSAPKSSLDGNDHTLSWTAVTYADYYQLEYRDGSGTWNLAGTNYTGTSKLWVDSAPVNQRSYRMRACNESGCGAWSGASNAVSIIAMMQAPTATLSHNDLTLAWTPLEGAVHYLLQFRDGQGDWKNAGTTYSGDNKEWLNVTPLFARSYRMKACIAQDVCSWEWSAASNAVTVYAAIGAPQAKLEGNDLILSWTAVSGMDHYRLEFRDGQGDWRLATQQFYGSSQRWVNVEPLSDRSYRMRACDTAGQCPSPWSAPSNAVTVGAANIIKTFEWTPATVTVGQAATLNWDIAGMQVCYEQQADLSWSEINLMSGAREGEKHYTPSTVETKWYCTDTSGVRYPRNVGEFIKANLEVTPLSAPGQLRQVK